MMVREWDPLSASPMELESILATLNAVLATDLPGDPPWCRDMLGEYLGITMPGERRLCWVAQKSSGDMLAGKPVLGMADVLLFGDLAVVEVMVHPAARREGVGRALLRMAVRQAHEENFRAMAAEVIGGTPAVGFYEANGFRCAYVETRSILSLDTVDWAALAEKAASVSAGYRLEYYAGGLPDELIEAYAEAKQVMRDIDDGDLDLRPSSYDPNRLRTSLATLAARGMTPYIVVAVHERTGKVAGLTEVVAPVQHPRRADQYDTIVVPEHRGYGLGRAMKARMLLELRSAEPLLREVQTWNGPENAAMRKVNAELGFKPDREWREYEADVSELLRRLG